MTFSDKMKELFSKGIEGSKEFFAKAGEKARDLSEMGVLQVEIQMLKSQAAKIAAELGMNVYASMVERGDESITREDPGIQDSLDKLKKLDADIDEKEERLKNIGKKEGE
jgi:hypothetical protein